MIHLAPLAHHLDIYPDDHLGVREWEIHPADSGVCGGRIHDIQRSCDPRHVDCQACLVLMDQYLEWGLAQEAREGTRNVLCWKRGGVFGGRIQPLPANGWRKWDWEQQVEPRDETTYSTIVIPTPKRKRRKCTPIGKKAKKSPRRKR